MPKISSKLTCSLTAVSWVELLNLAITYSSRAATTSAVQLSQTKHVLVLGTGGPRDLKLFSRAISKGANI